jgi:hypothetical protein
MVLIDSAHEEQYLRYPEPLIETFPQTLRTFRLLRVAAGLGLLALNPAPPHAEGQLPLAAAQAHHALTIVGGKVIGTMLAETESMVRGETRPITTLGDIPLVVLSHGKIDQGAVPVSPKITPQVVQQYEKTWQTMQAELAALSSKGRRIVVADSGHNIQIERPDIVIAAVQEVVEQVK